MKEPYFWNAGLDPKSRESAPLTRLLMSPLAWLYRSVTDWKINHTTPIKVSARVICIGNLTAGGVGKSPVVATVRKRLDTLTDERVCSLSRGYGGRLKGPLKVDPVHHRAEDVGDEPLMLSLSGESWIGADRANAGLTMSEAGVGVIVMDDGHQNPSLHKDLTFIVVDTQAQFGNGHIIPKGPLRERVDTGLSRANAVILMGEGPYPEQVTASGLPVMRARITPTAALPDQPYVAFAGIGQPQKFFDTLNSINADLRDAIPFPDHHKYSRADLHYLSQLAADHGATLITTEKDLARLPPDQRENILTLPVEAQFEDMAQLDKFLSDMLKAKPL